MTEFVDSKNRTYRVEINIGTLMRVKSKLGVDLLNLSDTGEGKEPLITRLWNDEFLLAEILACLLEEQFQGYSEEQMFEAFDGVTLFKASECFYQALTDFFRSSARPEKAELVRKQKQLVKEVIETATKAIAEIDIKAAADRAEQAIKQTSGI